jgi:Na+(H+)/acetate symporter ActP
MGDRPWWLELAGGLAGAVVIPLLLGLTWGRFAAAGAIAGIALAVLLHVTVVLALLTLAYQLAEWSVRRAPRATAVAAAVVVLACAVLTASLVASA